MNMGRCTDCLRAFGRLLNQQYSDADDGVDRTSMNELPLHRLRRTRVLLHPTFAALHKSAEEGCPLCRRLNQPLLSQISSRRYKVDLDGPVYLERVWENFKAGDLYCRSHVAVAGLGQSFLSLLDEPSWLADFPLNEWEENDHFWLHKRKETADLVKPRESVARWLAECSAMHEKCRDSRRVADRFMPTRLLEVRNVNDKTTVRLVLSSALTEDLSYVTLSYMWGKGIAWGGKIKHVTTTNENYSAYCEAIDYSALPRTFRDAIWLTLELGFNHIWIDALCIIQPSKNDTTDWDVEASRMRDVYAHSALTIAAASAPTVHDGLYISPEDLKFRAEPCRVDDLFDSDHWLSKGKPHHHEIWINPRDRLWEDSVIDSPLSTRGWVLQERLFSRRTVFMTQECIFWQCQQTQASEQKPLGINEASAWDVTWQTIESEGFSLQAWYSLLHVYSYKNLTETKDKLPAFAGIAKSFSDANTDPAAAATGTSYLAGLWRTDLARGLLWFTDISEFEWTSYSSPSSNTATARTAGLGPPSWSWASIPTQATYDGPVEHSLTSSPPAYDGQPTTFHPLITVHDATIDPAGPDIFGRVNGGTLTLSGVMALFERRDLDPNELSSVINQIGLVDTNGDGAKAILFFDEMKYLDKEVVVEELGQWVPCLLVGETRGDDALQQSRRYYLALEKRDGDANGEESRLDVFRRVGLVVQMMGSKRKRKRDRRKGRQQKQEEVVESQTQTRIVLV